MLSLSLLRTWFSLPKKIRKSLKFEEQNSLSSCGVKLAEETLSFHFLFFFSFIFFLTFWRRCWCKQTRAILSQTTEKNLKFFSKKKIAETRLLDVFFWCENERCLIFTKSSSYIFRLFIFYRDFEVNLLRLYLRKDKSVIKYQINNWSWTKTKARYQLNNN